MPQNVLEVAEGVIDIHLSEWKLKSVIFVVMLFNINYFSCQR